MHSKRFLIRLITKSIFLFFGLHYTWLNYHSYVSNVSTISHEGDMAILELSSNHTSQTNWTPPSDTSQTNWKPSYTNWKTDNTSRTKRTTSQDHRLNVSIQNLAFPHCERSVFVLVVIFSAPKNFEQRSIIRSTWAKIKDTDPDIANIINKGSYTGQSLVKTMFLLGQTDKKIQNVIETESEYYNDLVIGSFTDSYGNLTLKAKLGLEWAHKFCKFEYYLKTDDDVFVYSIGLVKLLWQLPRERVYTGRCDFNKTVIRTAGHKWGVSKMEYKRDTFPPYCVGMGYIFSSDVLQNMMSIVPTQPRIVLEDVYIGLILEKLKIVPVDRRKHLQVHYDYSWDVCKHKDLLLSLEANPKQMLQLHLKFSRLGKCGLVDYV